MDARVAGPTTGASAGLSGVLGLGRRIILLGQKLTFRDWRAHLVAILRFARLAVKRFIESHDCIIEIGRETDPEHIGQQQPACERRIGQHTNTKRNN